MPSGVRRIGVGLVLLGVVVLVVLFAAGVIGGREKVAPGRDPEPPSLPEPARTAVVRREVVPVTEDAVGTVRSRTVVEVASQVMARVLEVSRAAGQEVDPKTPLVVLDDREFAARLSQAKQALAAAEAAKSQAEQLKVQSEVRLKQATLEDERARSLLATHVISKEKAEEAETAFLQAKADFARAEASILAAEAQRSQATQVVAEADVALGHTRVSSPIAGVVVERRVEPGDLASPGKPLLVVIDPHALRVEAHVRERLISRLALGQALEVEVPAAGASAKGTVAEIVPSADPLSRTFLVRVDFGPVQGVYAGMFGRVRLATGTREAVLVPEAAVVRVGQLETVVVRSGARWERRLVTTGAPAGGGRVEVLSGLAGGETVGLAAEGPGR